MPLYFYYKKNKENPYGQYFHAKGVRNRSKLLISAFLTWMIKNRQNQFKLL